MKVTRDKVFGGVLGLVVGDALGLPVEGYSREQLSAEPVFAMKGSGVHGLPPGTWSDDGSLTLCLVESLCSGYDPVDIAGKFVRWRYRGYWTPDGDAFGIGGTTNRAIFNLRSRLDPLEAGPRGEFDNGNGSLMRILPVALYFTDKDESELLHKTHDISRITHGHPRSRMACGIYTLFARFLLEEKKLIEAYRKTVKRAATFYSHPPFEREKEHFSRILSGDLVNLGKDEISSSGYVVDTLEASLWCLLKNSSYSETVLAAVNLGGDTDTTAAVAGGLAGVYYGYDAIPSRWIESLARLQDILSLMERFWSVIREKAKS